MALVVDIRSLITEEGAAALLRQSQDARAAFPKARLVLLACGAPVPAEIASCFDDCIHYSKAAIGYTAPWVLALDYARTHGASDLIVVDGNDQHVMDNVSKAFEQTPAGLTVPQRAQRVVFSRDPIDGPTLEDLENGFLRQKHKLALRDLQSGLFIFRGSGSFAGLELKGLPDWVGDLAFYDRFLALHPNAPIHAPPIEVRAQHFTLSSRQYIFQTIRQHEKYFKIGFADVVKKALIEPQLYLPNGSPSRIDDILTAYRQHLNAEAIRGMKGLILAAGRGSRLEAITAKSGRPKPLIPIVNKPMIFYVIEQLVNAGISEIGIVIGPEGEQIRKAVGDGFLWKVRITYILQESPKGVAHAVACAKEYLGLSPFVLYLSDNFFRDDISGFVRSFAGGGEDVRLMLAEVDDPSAFGVATLDSENRVKRLEEKPKKPDSRFAVSGVYAFRPAIWKAIGGIKPSARGELEITDAIQALLDGGGKVSAEVVSGWWHDTGTVQSLLRANWMVLDGIKHSYSEGEIAPGAELIGRVQVGKGSRIAAGAQIRGPVVIGPGCEIGEGCVIGPYTSLGEGCKVSRTRMEYCIAFEQARVRDAGLLADSVIGRFASVEGDGGSGGKRRQLVAGDGH